MPDYGHDLLFGSFITPNAGSPASVVGLAQASEEAGLDLEASRVFAPDGAGGLTVKLWLARDRRLLIADPLQTLQSEFKETA